MKPVGSLRLAFNAKKVGWYIYMIGDHSYAFFGKGAKPDTKVLKQFTDAAKQQKGKVFRGAIRKVGGDANPMCVVQPAGTQPPLPKFYADLRSLANKAGVSGLLPKSATEMLFNPKVHNAPEEEDEEEEEEASSAPVSAPASAPPRANVLPLKERLKRLIDAVSGDYDDIMTIIAKMDELSPAAEADLGLFTEIYSQIEKMTRPAALDKVPPAKADAYIRRVDDLANQLGENKNFVKRQGWFQGNAPKPKLNDNDLKANTKLFDDLKKQFADIERGYTSAISKIIDDNTKETAAEALYRSFVRVEALMKPATKSLKLTTEDRMKYQKRVEQSIESFRQAVEEATVGVSNSDSAPTIDPANMASQPVA